MIALLTAGALHAQEGFDYADYTYVPNIRTVRMHVDGFPHSLPLVELQGGAQLLLSFDDMDNEVRRYRYRIIHCDMNWQPSGLAQMEYNPGFEEDNITEYDFSFRTLTNYVHYSLRIPNDNVRWTKSGNYLLVVYEDEDERRPVITRRFMVVDRRVDIAADVVRPAEVSKIQTHQEVDFVVNLERFPVRSPMQELRASVIQNGRWDNAVIGIQPSMLRVSEVIFDHQGKVSFAGGNEFRNLDIRSIHAPAAGVEYIGVEENSYAITLDADPRRDGRPYLYYPDLNGDFVNIRYDRPLLNLTDQYFLQNYDRLQLEYTGEYANVLFSLKTSEPYFDYDVYLFGAITEWKLKPEYKMVYNEAINGYVVNAYLKQGFYNYYYVLTPGGKAARDGKREVILAETEGSYTEAENEYQVLVYYRPFGGRYDQLVGGYGISSLE